MQQKPAHPPKDQKDAERVFRMWEPFPFETPPGYNYQRNTPFQRICTTGLQNLAKALLAVLDKLLFGLRIEGREYLKQAQKRGFVTISNHIHPMDCTMLSVALRWRRTYYVSIEANFRIPVIRHLIRVFGAVPLPNRNHTMRELFDAMGEALQRGSYVQMYPEGVMVPYDQSLRPFRSGAFRLAVRNGAPVLPVVILQRPASGLYRLYKRGKPCFTVKILPPIEPDPSLSKREAADLLKERCRKAMGEALERGTAKR